MYWFISGRWKSFAYCGSVFTRNCRKGLGLLSEFLKADQSAADVDLNRRLFGALPLTLLFLSPLCLSLSLSYFLHELGLNRPMLLRFLWCTHHGQSPLTSAGWQSGVEWLATEDKLPRYDLELLNLWQTHSRRGQSAPLCLFKSVSPSLSPFLSFMLVAIKFGNEFPPRAARRKQTPGTCTSLLQQWCFVANNQLLWCFWVLFFFFMSRSGPESGHHLTHSGPA